MLQLLYLEEYTCNQFYTRVAYDLKYGNLFLWVQVITFIFVKNVLRIRPWFYHFNSNEQQIQIMKHTIMQFSPTCCSFFRYLNMVCILYLKTLSLFSSLNMADWFSHPHTTEDSFVYILIFLFLRWW